MPDRLIQAICLLVAVGAFVGAAALQPGLDRTRKDWKLVMEPQGLAQKEPLYRLLENAGALRGVAINALWYRLEDLKQKKRYYEADTLGRRIVELQPRMPEVWRFIAWNMAYNISVKCTTEEERWAWVSKGIDLLKKEGVPNCPDIYTLYYELGWTYQHKIGGETDDVNQYYKRRVAQRWHDILGEPRRGMLKKADGASEDAAIADFRPVAEAASDWLTLPSGELAGAMSAEKQKAYLEAHPAAKKFLLNLKDQWARGGHDKATGLPVPDLSSLRLAEAAGRVRAIGVYSEMAPQEKLRERVGPDGRALVECLVADPANQQGLIELMPLLAAMRIAFAENMDPRAMLATVEQWGPLDWRHPNSHAIYWTDLGRRKAKIGTRYTRINADRILLHSSQALLDSGRVFYDPVLDTVSLQPDPRFIPSYGKVQEEIRAKVEADYYKDGELGTGNPLLSLLQGDEHFLHRAIQVSYLFGDEAEAMRYFEEVRQKYPDSRTYKRYYTLSLDDFVTVTIRQDSMRVVQRSAVLGLLIRSMEEQFLAGNLPKAQRLFATARNTVDGVRVDLSESHIQVQATDIRQQWPSFEQFYIEAATRFFAEPRYNLRQRAAVWDRIPNDLKFALFPAVQATAWPQVEAAGLGVKGSDWFPAPAGWDKAMEERAKAERNQRGPTGDRQ